MNNPLNKKTDAKKEAGSQQPNKGKPQPKSKADSLVKKKPAKKGAFSNPLVLIGLIVGCLITIGIIIFVVAMMGGDKSPQTQAIPEAPTAEDIAAAEKEQRDAEALEILEGGENSTVPLFAQSATPIYTLATNVVEGAETETPQFLNGDGVNLRFPDGSVLPINHPFLKIAKTNAEKRVVDYIEQNDIIQERASDSGGKSFYIRLPNGEFTPITDATAATEVEQGMRRQAVVFLTEELANAPAQQPVEQQQPVAPPPPVIVDELGQQERAEYRELIEKTRMINRDLIDENRELKNELQSQKEAMVKVLQRIEDDKLSARKLRASALSLKSGWKVHAIQNDRLWLYNPEGQLVSVADGEQIPSTNIRVIATDEPSGFVYITETK